MAKASQLMEQAAAYRELAKRARRLAGSFVDGPDRDRLLEYAKELDEKAAGLEAPDADRSPAQPAVTHEQQQVQQQASDPEPEPPDPKTKA